MSIPVGEAQRQRPDSGLFDQDNFIRDLILKPKEALRCTAEVT